MGFSDRRLKRDIRPLRDALQKVQGIRGVYYHWNRNVTDAEGLSEPGTDGQTDFESRRQIGVIAQDVLAVAPEIVSGGLQGKQSEFLRVDYNKLVPLLIEAVRELNGQLKLLEGDIDGLSDDKKEEKQTEEEEQAEEEQTEEEEEEEEEEALKISSASSSVPEDQSGLGSILRNLATLRRRNRAERSRGIALQRRMDRLEVQLGSR